METLRIGSRASASRYRGAAASSAATTRPTTGPRGGCPPTCARPSTRCTASCAGRMSSSTARARPPTPRPAARALDAWEAALERGLRAGAREHPVIARAGRRRPRHDLPLGRAAASTCDSMRVDCGAGAAAHARGARPLHGRPARRRSGAIMAPLLGAPRAHQADFARLGRGLPAHELHPRRARGLRSWTASTCPALSGSDLGVAEADSRREPVLRALSPGEVGRARELFAGAEPAVAAAPARACGRGMRLARAVYLGVLDRVERSASTCSAAARLRPGAPGRRAAALRR